MASFQGVWMRFVRSNWLVEVVVVLALTVFFLLLSATMLPLGGSSATPTAREASNKASTYRHAVVCSGDLSKAVTGSWYASRNGREIKKEDL